MKKKEQLKRRKFTTNTYMKEAVDYDILIIKEGNVFITIKKYKEVTEPIIFPVGDEMITYIDNGYYLLEITPLDEHYNIRYYYDENQNYVDCYIDMTLKNGVEYKLPYYIDLYLDILHNPKSGEYFFVDEEELEEALQKKKISKKDYQLAYQVGNQLLEEIRQKENPYFNMDVKPYMKKMKS